MELKLFLAGVPAIVTVIVLGRLCGVEIGAAAGIAVFGFGLSILGED